MNLTEIVVFENLTKIKIIKNFSLKSKFSTVDVFLKL